MFTIIVIGLLLTPASNQLSACDDLSGFRRLMAGSPRSRYEYRGRYVNWAYEYSVRIPKGVTAYDARVEARHNGFAFALGKASQSVIFISGDPNSVEYNTPIDAAKRDVEFLRQQGKNIQSETISKSHLGTLDAALLVVFYSCPGSENRYVRASMLALSPDKRFLYEVELYSFPERYESDRAVLSQMAKSWKLERAPRQPQHQSRFSPGTK